MAQRKATLSAKGKQLTPAKANKLRKTIKSATARINRRAAKIRLKSLQEYHGDSARSGYAD